MDTAKDINQYSGQSNQKKIENMNVLPEAIYMFCKSQENLLKLNDYLSEKLMEIDPNFELELKIIN